MRKCIWKFMLLRWTFPASLSRFFKSATHRQGPMKGVVMQNLTGVTFRVSEKTPTLRVWPLLACHANTDHYISYELQAQNKQTNRQYLLWHIKKKKVFPRNLKYLSQQITVCGCSVAWGQFREYVQDGREEAKYGIRHCRIQIWSLDKQHRTWQSGCWQTVTILNGNQVNTEHEWPPQHP